MHPRGLTVTINFCVHVFEQGFIILVENVCQTDYRVLKHTATSSNLTHRSVNNPQKPTMFVFICAYAYNAPDSLISYL